MIELLNNKEYINFKENVFIRTHYLSKPCKNFIIQVYLICYKITWYVSITNLNLLTLVLDHQARWKQSHPFILCLLYSILPQVPPKKVTWNVRETLVRERWKESENEVRIIKQAVQWNYSSILRLATQTPLPAVFCR